MAYGIFTPQLLTKTNSITAKGYPWTGRNAQWAATAMAYNGSVFVAGASGNSRLTYSYDGMNWSTGSDFPIVGPSSLVFGNGIMVAVANTGGNRVATSTNGTSWTGRSASQANSWRTVTFGNGLFVAVSNDGTNRVMTSPDGVSWTNRTASQANAWFGVSYGNGLFVAVANNGTNRVMTSPDGITWTNRTASRAGAWLYVKFVKDRFYAFDRTSRDVMYSLDGITWVNLTIAGSTIPTAMDYMGGVFVIVGSGSTTYSSIDGVTWQQNSGISGNWSGMAVGNNLFVASSGTTTGANSRMTAP